MMSHSRSRRAFWGDVRFLVGIALVVLSIAGVWLTVSSARQTTPVLQANRTITQGEALVSGDFQVIEVSLGSATEGYLAPQDLAPGLIAARTLSTGELIPTSATADADDARTTTIVIESTARIPASVTPGTVVELWHAPPLPEAEGYEAPRILVADVVVASVPEDDGVLAERSTALEIIIDRADVAAVLAAITDGAAVSVVPIGSGS